MPALRRFELDDIVNRPGTYFNPDSEVMIVVDDTQSLDAELFGADDEGGDWVLIAEELPIDDQAREELVERFEVGHHPGSSGAVAAGEDDPDELDDELEPDPDPDADY